MNRIYTFLALAFFIVAPPRIAWRLWDDWHHRERWTDPLHNPYVSFTLLGVFVALAAGLGVYVARGKA